MQGNGIASYSFHEYVYMCVCVCVCVCVCFCVFCVLNIILTPSYHLPLKQCLLWWPVEVYREGLPGNLLCRGRLSHQHF